jgi:hypothetical protein
MLTEARELLRDGKADVLVAYSPDRLARDVALLSLLFTEVAKHKAQLLTVMMPVDQSPMGKAALQMSGVFAEMERAMFTERSKRGKDTLARQGRIFTGNYVPYGYNYDNGRLLVNEEEAMWVRRMYEWSAEGMSSYGIARKLTEIGVKPKRGGTFWHKNSVRDMLRSTTYRGEWRFGKKVTVEPKKPRKAVRRKPNSSWAARDASEVISVPCPAIVTPELWQKAQQRLDEGKRKTRPAKFRYLLSGRVRCACCGRAYAGSGGAQNPYYNCPGKQRDVYGTGQPCPNKARNARLFDEEVWTRIEQVMCDPDAIMGLFNDDEGVDAEHERITADLRECERKLAELDRRANNLLDLAESGDIDKLTFRGRKARLDRERGSIVQLRDELAGRTEASRRPSMTREQVEHLARSWQSHRAAFGHPYLADIAVIEAAEAEGRWPSREEANAFSQDDFKQWALDAMSVEVTMEPTRSFVRGTIKPSLLEWSAELGEVTARRRGTASRAETNNSLYCTSHRRTQPRRHPLRQVAALPPERPRPTAG